MQESTNFKENTQTLRMTHRKAAQKSRFSVGATDDTVVEMAHKAHRVRMVIVPSGGACRGWRHSDRPSPESHRVRASISGHKARSIPSCRL